MVKENKPRIYLAHPTKMLEYVIPFAKEIEEATGVEIVNPFFENKSEACSVAKIRAGEKDPFVSESEEMSELITEGDLKIINECDGMLAFLPREVSSFGTHMEVFYHGYVLGKKISTFVVSEDFKNHPWVEYCTNEECRFNTFDEFIEYINQEGFPSVTSGGVSGWQPLFYESLFNACKKEGLNAERVARIVKDSLNASFNFDVLGDEGENSSQ